eukprot:c24721_g1_i1 orf=550-3522(-)
MDLSLQALQVVPWQREQGTWMRRMRCSTSQLGLLARRTQFPGGVRCSAVKGEEDPAQETRENKPLEPPKGAVSGSWVQGEAASADPYLGWTSDGSQHPQANNAAAWKNIGGVAVLAIGFALGARSIYTRRDVAKEFAVLPSATQESVHSSSKAPEAAIETQDDVDGNKLREAPESNSEGSLEDAKESNRVGPVSDLQLQDEGTPEQVSAPMEETEDRREIEASINESSAAATMWTSEKVEQEEASETSVANEHLLSPPEDATEKGSYTTDSAVLEDVKDTSTATEKEEVSPNVTETADISDKDIDVGVELSIPSFASTEENNSEDILEEPGVATTFKEELADQEAPLFKGATSLLEPTLDESSLHDGDIIEDLQGATPDLEVLGSLAREGSLEKTTRQQDEWDEGKPSIDLLAASAVLDRRFVSATITAPATPPDSLPNLVGNVVVPAPVDHMQEQVLAALQALKVIEADVKPGEICTRREYARWLMAASSILTRSPAHKVLPSMYIEKVSVLAYEDVVPEDQDFPFIQGLAEAGLLSSRLLGDDKQHEGGNNHDDCLFSPDSHLTRQDLVTWRVALERKPAVLDEISSLGGMEALQRKVGFIDVDKIHEDAWPALLVDINAGEQSIISLAFGHTRRLQPQMPVTKGQAAVALATGEAWELVSEELTRLEAESVAEAAVVAELALETKAQQEVASAFQELLQVEREKQHQTASLVESMQAELEQVKADRESEKYALMKEKATLDSQKEFLSSARLEVEEQALALSTAKLEVAFQREQADKLRAEAEEEKTLISKVRSELEIEKNALMLARSWAEAEARKAQEHSKALEQVRSRWESQGVQVNVDKELDTVDEKVNSFSPSWQYSEGLQAENLQAENLQAENSPMDGLAQKSRDIRKMLVDALLRFLQFVQLIFHAIKERATDLFGKVGEKFHEARITCAVNTTKTVEGLKQTVPSSVAGMTSSLKEGTLKVVDEWKGGAEKLLSQKFKTP